MVLQLERNKHTKGHLKKDTFQLQLFYFLCYCWLSKTLGHVLVASKCVASNASSEVCLSLGDPLVGHDDPKAKETKACPCCLCVCFPSLSHPVVLTLSRLLSCSLKGLRIKTLWMTDCVLFLSGTLKVRVKLHLRSPQDALLITTSCWHEEGGQWAY